MKIHKQKEKGLLFNGDGTWNILCKSNKSSSCKASEDWRIVTCKNCLKLKE